MLLVETIVGNVNLPEWASRLEGSTIDVLTLDQWEAQKNRLRKETEQGVELAIVLDRNRQLRDGDILAWNEAARTAVVARIQLQDVLVVRLDEVLARNAESLAQTCFELGHALGNQHWPAVIKGATIYIPLTIDRRVMASVMKTHAFSGVTYEFAEGTEVIPFLAPHESRRLFGGANATPHAHTRDLPQSSDAAALL
jgi:urease accessory protein